MQSYAFKSLNESIHLLKEQGKVIVNIQNILRITLIYLLFVNTLFATTTHLAFKDIGSLTDIYSDKGTSDIRYKFYLAKEMPVSIFLNGLSAGYSIQLLNENESILKASSNTGTQWLDPAHPGDTGGVIVANLPAGNYFVDVKPIEVTGNIFYKSQDNTFTLNIIPDEAPNMIIVTAHNSMTLGHPHFIASGINDEVTLNQAIEEAAKLHDGKVLLRPGTYNIYNNVLIVFDNITILGTGWTTILKLAPNIRLQDAGLIRSAFHEPEKNSKTTHFSKQHFLHFCLDGNKGEKTNFSNGYGTYGTYENSTFEDIRIHDFPHYGFDPHGNVNANPRISTEKLRIKDSLSDHNDVDGMTTDACNNSIFINNILDGNKRHGINVCTGATNNSYIDNVIINNGGNGITIQSGGDKKKVSNNHIIRGNLIRKNNGAGIFLFRSENNTLEKNMVIYTYNYGIHLRSSSNNIIRENIVHNNSALDSSFIIYMSNDGEVYSNHNQIINNNISSNTNDKRKFGLAEATPADDYNIWNSNSLTNVKTRIRGPHSVQQ